MMSKRSKLPEGYIYIYSELMKTIRCAYPHHHIGFVATCRLWTTSLPLVVHSGMSHQTHWGDEEDGHIGLSSWLHEIRRVGNHLQQYHKLLKERARYLGFFNLWYWTCDVKCNSLSCSFAVIILFTLQQVSA